MKKTLLAVISCTILLCGCVSDKEYAELKAQNEQYSSQLSQYQYELSQKDEQIAQLENKYNSFKNSAGISLSRIREAYFLGKYETVVFLTEQLYENHPDSQEYSNALDLYQTAKTKVEEKKEKEQQEREKKRKETAKAETTTTTSSASTYEWKLKTNSTGKDWNKASDTEKDVWCSNSITAWRVMGYDIPSSVSISHMHKSLDYYYENVDCVGTDLTTASEAYAIASGIY